MRAAKPAVPIVAHPPTLHRSTHGLKASHSSDAVAGDGSEGLGQTAPFRWADCLL